MTYLVALFLVLLLSATANGQGLAISKISKPSSSTITEPRLDGIVCTVAWKDFQPTSASTVSTSILESCIASGAANNKVAVVQVNFMPPDVRSGYQSVPQWAKTAGVRVVSLPTTNEFPVWWNPTYKNYAKNAIILLTNLYNGDTRVAGYVMTGYAGVLSTSLAGSQSDALCPSFQAEGYNGVCPPDSKGDMDMGSVYEDAVLDMMGHWVSSSSKPLVYLARNPIDPGSLAELIEANIVDLNPQVAVMNSGFTQCSMQAGIVPRYQDLQAAGHIVGWWSIAPWGFPSDTLANAIYCTAASLDEAKLWLAFQDVTWTSVNNPGALDAAFDIFH